MVEKFMAGLTVAISIGTLGILFGNAVLKLFGVV